MLTDSDVDVVVVGAGVTGLSTAVSLAESGFRVRVVAEQRPEFTTSALAGASSCPYLVTDPRVVGWGNHTLAVLQSIAALPARTGVRLRDGLEAAPYHLDPPDWARHAPRFRLCVIDELPPGFVSGWRCQIPIVDMPTYLTYLESRLVAAGATVEPGRVDDKVKLARLGRIVVNCTGLGARDLVADSSVTPALGQLVLVANPGIDYFFQDYAEGDDLTYFLPHDDYIVLGGTNVEGVNDTTFDSTVANEIIARCVRIESRLGQARVLGHRVGLRPARPEVRVEQEDLDGSTIIHNYGHGGSGLTFSWGCSHEVVNMVGAITQENKPACDLQDHRRAAFGDHVRSGSEVGGSGSRSRR